MHAVVWKRMLVLQSASCRQHSTGMRTTSRIALTCRFRFWPQVNDCIQLIRVKSSEHFKPLEDWRSVQIPPRLLQAAVHRMRTTSRFASPCDQI